MDFFLLSSNDASRKSVQWTLNGFDRKLKLEATKERRVHLITCLASLSEIEDFPGV